jgi:glyoxylase-like metal-dependent hydrolase (beta-lactamase superfamily II)
MTERDLRDLGIFRVPVPIPFTQAGGPANVYAVEEAGGGILLFDTGLGTPEAEAALEAGIRRAGYGFSDVRRIVISHGHVDHYGAARTVLERNGGEVPVYAHPADIPKIAEDGPRWRDRLPLYVSYFAKLGVPAEAMAASTEEIGRGFRLARRLPRIRPLPLEDPLRLRHMTLEPMHMPGHTPGVVCLYDREHRVFFSDDHLLEKISPNPLIELGPNGEEGLFRPLVAYLESVGRLHALDVNLVLPGHADPFGGHRRVIDSLVLFFGKRQAKIRALLGKGPLAAFEVTQGLFPWAKPRDLFLTVSESVANLEVLEARGEVARDLNGGIYQFRLAA